MSLQDHPPGTNLATQLGHNYDSTDNIRPKTRIYQGVHRQKNKLLYTIINKKKNKNRKEEDRRHVNNPPSETTTQKKTQLLTPPRTKQPLFPRQENYQHQSLYN